MSKNKLFYESPEAETFVVRIERSIMSQTENVRSSSFVEDEAVVEDYSNQIWW